MLHFAAGVYKGLFSTPEYNVLIVGRECAGKSTLLEQLKFLYTPSTQKQEVDAVREERQQQQAPSAAQPSRSGGDDGASTQGGEAGESSRGAPSTPPTPGRRRAPLPPGTPIPASAAHLAHKRIRPTVGLNYAVVQHRFSPPVAVVARVARAKLPSRTVATLPPPPAEVLMVQRERQQAVMANPPCAATTRVVLRDLGGQSALRELWEKYYPQSQALVYVVDSTLPFRLSSAAAPTSQPRDHFSMRELEDVYQQDRQLLARLLQHPLLRGVPVLLLSNKTDEAAHVPLTALQEALQLADMAADPHFYVAQNGGDGEDVDAESSNDGGGGQASTRQPSAAPTTASVPLSRHCTRSDEAQRKVGESGFGEIAMRVMEVSALDGVGVAGAMDWVVAQLLHDARTVDGDA
ncbi:ADP-ribosylation factor family [Novymonas esmeraldas]|uniref:ADP-ribosylation factor family n=1 Tax=Novymonas esmeraldas TaxID=1808958 RepID=A0AAW0EJT5_9TRYP